MNKMKSPKALPSTDGCAEEIETKGGGDEASKALGLPGLTELYDPAIAIARFLISSGITLAALKGLVQIIVKLIENEGKKSLTIRLTDREVSVQGANADELIKKAVAILNQHEGDVQLELTSKQPELERQ